MRPPGLVAAGAALAASLSTLGASAQQRPPAFRSGVDLVMLDVTALDRDRRPIRGLTAADFTVLEDGRPRPVAAFSSVEAEETPPPAAAWMRDVAPDVATNDLGDSRLFVLVLDDALIPQDPRIAADAKRIARGLIDRLAPADLMAVVFTGDNRHAQDFTRDRARLLAALDRFSPGLATWHFGYDSGQVPPPVNTDAYFYSAAVNTLANVADFLIAVPDKRKVLFWLSPGVPLDVAATAPQLAAGVENTPMADREIMTTLLRQTDEIFRRAARAHVSIYPIDPTGLGGLETYLRRTKLPADQVSLRASQSLDFVMAAAANTGGRALVNTNDFEPGLSEIFAENASYYLIGFPPASVAADGRLHRVEVKVNRPGVEVRTRSGYYARRATDDAGASGATPEAAALGRAIGGILPDPTLPLQAAIAPFAVPGQRSAAVTIALGVRQPIAGDDRSQQTTELLTSAFTPEGQPRGSQRHTARIRLRPGASGEAEYDVLGRIDLAPGRYRLRLAAHNRDAGTSGSVFADVVVPDFEAASFATSGIVLSSTPGRPSAPRDALAPVLPVVPTSVRAFLARETLAAFLQLYQNGRRPLSDAMVTVRIMDATDRVVVREARPVTAASFRPMAPAAAMPEPRARGGMPSRGLAETPPAGLHAADVLVPVPLDRLGPGPHVLVVEAAAGGTSIRREVRFAVR
jgi:VWFA-related protein